MRAVVAAAIFTTLAWSQSADDLFRAGVDAQQRGDLTAAVRDYQQALHLNPKLVDAQANMAVALVHLGRFDDAVGAYRAALKLDPGNAGIRGNLALAFYKTGDFRSAAGELQVLHEAQPNDVRIATLLGDCYVRLSENEKAIAATEPLEQANIDNPDLEYVLGTALMNVHKEREGVERMERVAKARQTVEAFFLAGKTRLKLDEYPAAAADLDEAARLNPNLSELYTLRGVAREGNGDEKGAEADYRKALDANANDLEANVHLGGLLYVRRDLPEAKKYLDRALQIDPSSLFAQYQMALWKSASGQVDSAVADLEKVVKKDPSWLQAHVELAALYFRLHRPEDGQRERQIVDKLSAEQQKAGPRLQP